MVLRWFWEVFGSSERVWNGFKWFSEGFRRFLEDFRRVRGGGPWPALRIRPPKEGRVCGEGAFWKYRFPCFYIFVGGGL